MYLQTVAEAEATGALADIYKDQKARMGFVMATAFSMSPRPDLLPLYAFYGGTLASISFYGGNFSCLPPYLAKTFGPQHMGAIHGRVLSAWAVSAFTGPKVLSYLRERSNSSAVDELVTSPFSTFGYLATLLGRARLGAANHDRAVRDYAEQAMVDAYASLYGEALASPDILR